MPAPIKNLLGAGTPIADDDLNGRKSHAMATSENKHLQLEQLLKERLKEYKVKAQAIAEKLHAEGHLENRQIEDYINCLVEGFCEGYYEAHTEVATKLKQMGIAIGTISLATGLTAEEVDRL